MLHSISQTYSSGFKTFYSGAATLSIWAAVTKTLFDFSLSSRGGSDSLPGRAISLIAAGAIAGVSLAVLRRAWHPVLPAADLQHTKPLKQVIEQNNQITLEPPTRSETSSPATVEFGTDSANSELLKLFKTQGQTIQDLQNQLLHKTKEIDCLNNDVDNLGLMVAYLEREQPKPNKTFLLSTADLYLLEIEPSGNSPK